MRLHSFGVSVESRRCKTLGPLLTRLPNLSLVPREFQNNTRTQPCLPPPTCLKTRLFLPKIYRVRPMSCLPRKFLLEFVMGGSGAACLIFYHCRILYPPDQSSISDVRCLCPAEYLRSPDFKTKHVGRYPWPSENFAKSKT